MLRADQRDLLILEFPITSRACRGPEAGVSGDHKAHISERQAKRWLAGESTLPRPVCCRVLEHWWAEPVSRLLGSPDSDRAAVVMSEEELIVNAGRESVEHAIKAASALDPSALEHLHDAAQRAARAYYVTPPLAMLTDLVRLRDTVYEQLDRTHKPHQQAELYLLAGQFCGLLSSVSLDLGRMDMAEAQAQAAHTYGSVIDHQSLRRDVGLDSLADRFLVRTRAALTGPGRGAVLGRRRA